MFYLGLWHEGFFFSYHLILYINECIVLRMNRMTVALVEENWHAHVAEQDL